MSWLMNLTFKWMMLLILQMQRARRAQRPQDRALRPLFSAKTGWKITFMAGDFGQIGDFAESAMKRQVYVKDTGTILMGHGGFLDRFDSITFAAPLYYIYIVNFIQWYG